MKTIAKLFLGLWLLCAGCVRPDQPAAEDLVQSIEIISDQGGHVSWSEDGEWLAIDQLGEDGYFDIFVMRPDASDKRCLTCDKPAEIVPQKHNGTAERHPSGDYLVFR